MNINTIIFDFDGVLTNNKVMVDSIGTESVVCNRSDGLGIDFLKALKHRLFIISTEKNAVVSMRGQKLGIPVIQGVGSKSDVLDELVKSEGIDLKKSLFVGNDLNDYLAMKKCGFSCCPADSHKEIKAVADFVLITNGGDGVVRDILVNVLKINELELI